MSQSEMERYDENMRSEDGSDTMDWHWHSPDAPPFRLLGFAWFEREKIYRRLPTQSSEYSLPEAVDFLANHTAGGQIHFRTASRRVAVRVQLTASADAYHITATGQCGFDCYVAENGGALRSRGLRYCSTARFARDAVSYQSLVMQRETSQMRDVVLNFPLYQGVKSVQVGLEPGATLEEPGALSTQQPIVVYGTSIAQGGCATRPGMAYTNILSRRLNVQIINLGFSGSGRGEPQMARVMAEIENPLCLVLDYEANVSSLEQMQATLAPFIEILRAAHPHAPILVISRTPPIDEKKRDFQRETVEKLRAAGDANIHFADGSSFLGDDNEGTVDGAHPTDLGFLRMADNLEPILRRLAKL